MAPLNLIYGKNNTQGRKNVILITDGRYVESHDMIKDLVSRNSNNCRVFTVGIGKDVSRENLQELAMAGSGTFEFVDSASDFQSKVVGMLMALANESLTGFNIDWTVHGGYISKHEPSQLQTAYYYGKPMVQTISIERISKNAKIDGNVLFSSNEHGNVKVDFDMPQQDTALVLHRHASLKQAEFFGESPTRIKELVQLSEKSGIICRMSAFETETGNDEPGFAQDDRVEIVDVKGRDRIGSMLVPIAEDIAAPIYSFEAITGLQRMDGSWKLDDDLVKVVASPMFSYVNDIYERCKKFTNGRYGRIRHFDTHLAGTLIGLGLLHSRFPERRAQWAMMEQKAMKRIHELSGLIPDKDFFFVLLSKLTDVKSPMEADVEGYSQRAGYFSRVDRHALTVSADDDESGANIQQLVDRLINTGNVISDFDKARALFVWLSSKDLSKLRINHAPSGSAEDVLLGLMQGRKTYAAVYEMLCTRAGLQCVTVAGYVKGINYKPGMSLEGGEHKSSWNAVRIDGKWQLVNSNWAARRVMSHGLHYEMDEFFFLTDPRHLIFTHYPFDSRWQLLDTPIDLEDFVKLPLAKSQFFKLGLNLTESCQESVIEGDEVLVDLLINSLDTLECVDFDYALLFERDESIRVQELHKFVFHEIITDLGLVRFKIRLPRNDIFRFVVFVSKTNENGDVGKNQKIMYTDVCEWKLIRNNTKPNQDAVLPFPNCSGSKWGVPSGTFLKRRGFSAIRPSVSHLVVSSRNIAQVELEVATDQRIFFVGKLRTANPDVYNEKELEKLLLQRKVGNVSIFTVYPPGEGEFGLEIFTNHINYGDADEKPKFGQSDVDLPVFPLCQFLIRSSYNVQPLEGAPFPPIPPNFLGIQPTFIESGLTVLSHADPLIVLNENSQPQLEISFGQSNVSPVKAIATLTKFDENVDVSSHILHQVPMSSDRIIFVCRFPAPAFYKLQIFALPNYQLNTASSIPCIFNYLIDARKCSFFEPLSAFPTQHSQWHSGCFLIEPLTAVITLSSVSQTINVSFVPGQQCRRALAVVGETSKTFQVSPDGVMEASIPVDMLRLGDKLVVMANYVPDSSETYSRMLEFDIEK